MSTWLIVVLITVAVLGYLLYTFIQKELKTVNAAANGVSSLVNLADSIGNWL
jgi:hypothetical protein